MSHDLKDKVKADMIASMRAGDKERLSTIRMLQAAIKQLEVDQRIDLDDVSILTIVEKMIKQRRESIKQFQEGLRPELAAKEAQEILFLQEYLPVPYTADAVMQLIQEAIAEVGAATVADLGKVIAVLKPKIQGRADMAEVSRQIRTCLSS